MSTGISSARRPELHRLFYAVRPPEETAKRIVGGARHLRRTQGLTGSLLNANRLHITLCHLADFYGEPDPRILSIATTAAKAVDVFQFPVAFNRVLSFPRRSGKPPTVLCGDDPGFLNILRKSIEGSLVQMGLRRRVESNFTPHVTLLYGDRAIDERKIDPINWTVGEFTLIDSLVGQTRHIPLGRWPLRTN